MGPSSSGVHQVRCAPCLYEPGGEWDADDHGRRSAASSDSSQEETGAWCQTGQVVRQFRAASILCVFLWLTLGAASADDESDPTSAILGAFGEEVALLKEEMADKQTRTILGLRFLRGNLRGRGVVLAETGVGKVNAAMTVTLLLEHFRPSEVIFTGIAGALSDSFLPGDIVVGERTAQHDLTVLLDTGQEKFSVRDPVSGERNPIYFACDERLLRLAEVASERLTLEGVVTSRGKRTPRIRRGVIITGDAFVASSSKKRELRDLFQADAVEMEGAAVAQVCYQNGVPILLVRSISDKADESASQDLERFYQVAARNSAKLVIRIVELLALSN